MIAPVIPDDGLRNRFVGTSGTNKRWPCGHQRTPENTRVNGSILRCKLCRRRIERESKRRAS